MPRGCGALSGLSYLRGIRLSRTRRELKVAYNGCSLRVDYLLQPTKADGGAGRIDSFSRRT